MANLILLGLTPTRSVQLGNRLAKHYDLMLADFNKFPQEAPIPRSGVQQQVNIDIWLTMIEAQLDQENAENGYVLLGFPNDLIQAKALQKKLRVLKKPLSHIIYIENPSARQQPDAQLINFYAKKKKLITIADSKTLNTLVANIKKKIK